MPGDRNQQADNAPVATGSPVSVSIAPMPMQGDVEVQRGDTLYAISRRNQVPVRSLIEANDLQPPYILQPGQRLHLPGQRYHQVQRGETLYAISRAYDIDMYSLAQANDLPEPYLLNVGQSLRIPSSGAGMGSAGMGNAVALGTAPSSPSVSPSLSPSSPATGSISPTSSAGGVMVEALPPPSALPPSAVPQAAPQTVAPQRQQAPVQQQAPVSQAPVPPAAAPQIQEVKPAPETQQVAIVPPAPPAPPVAEPPAANPPPENPGSANPGPANPGPRAKAEDEPPPRSGRSFAWPVRGRILSTFGTKGDGTHNDGLNIAARAGAPVIAAENGLVVYSGNELRGFGNLLLLRHADGWITAYAHLDRVLVKKGQKVSRGQAIATVGSSGGVDQPQLHFEIRRGSQAVDPAKFLSVARLEDPGLNAPVFSAWLFPVSRPGGQPNPG